jgi:hypothetical protein
LTYKREGLVPLWGTLFQAHKHNMTRPRNNRQTLSTHRDLGVHPSLDRL